MIHAVESLSSISTETDIADEFQLKLNDNTDRAVKIYSKGDNDDEELARTLAKRVSRLPSRRKSYMAGLLESVEGRKRIRENCGKGARFI